jgi:hypothetical protein
MILIANKSFFDVTVGKVSEGQTFQEPRPKVVAHLIRSGLAREMVYETKVVRPEVKAGADPFRIVPLPDPEPPTVDSAGSGVLPVPDVPTKRTISRGGRRKRS